MDRHDRPQQHVIIHDQGEPLAFKLTSLQRSTWGWNTQFNPNRMATSDVPFAPMILGAAALSPSLAPIPKPT